MLIVKYILSLIWLALFGGWIIMFASEKEEYERYMRTVSNAMIVISVLIIFIKKITV